MNPDLARVSRGVCIGNFSLNCLLHRAYINSSYDQCFVIAVKLSLHELTNDRYMSSSILFSPEYDFHSDLSGHVFTLLIYFNV